MHMYTRTMYNREGKGGLLTTEREEREQEKANVIRY